MRSRVVPQPRRPGRGDGPLQRRRPASRRAAAAGRRSRRRCARTRRPDRADNRGLSQISQWPSTAGRMSPRAARTATLRPALDQRRGLSSSTRLAERRPADAATMVAGASVERPSATRTSNRSARVVLGEQPAQRVRDERFLVADRHDDGDERGVQPQDRTGGGLRGSTAFPRQWAAPQVGALRHAGECAKTRERVGGT